MLEQKWNNWGLNPVPSVCQAYLIAGPKLARVFFAGLSPRAQSQEEAKAGGHCPRLRDLRNGTSTSGEAFGGTQQKEAIVYLVYLSMYIQTYFVKCLHRI